MTYLTKFFASLLLVLGLVSAVSAASVGQTTDNFNLYQSETEQAAEGEGEEKKKNEGEEEEPECD